jgi:tetratricopeptide (TPR) repeat protein
MLKYKRLKNSQINPASAPIAEHFNVGLAFHQQGELAQAEVIYREILAGGANHVCALHLLGVVMIETNRLDGGVQLIDKALALKPDHADAFNNRGVALMKLMRLDEALESYDKALRLKPDCGDAHNNRGIVLKELRRLDEALESYDKALALKPDFANAHNNCGNVLKELGRLDEALESYDRALAFEPDRADTHINRGVVVKKLRRLDEALESYDKALALKPDFADAHNNCGNVLKDLRRLDEALESYDKALALKPDFADAHNNRGNVLKELGRLDEALESYDKALVLKPNYPEFGFNKSLCLLLVGHFESGWPLYENRKKTADAINFFAVRSYAKSLWTGREGLVGKTLFIYWEQGLGDVIQFCRFAKCAEQRRANVVLSVQNRLRKVLSSLSPTIKFADEKEAPPEFDYHCPLLSLPLAFEMTLDKVPDDTPYLRAEPERVRKWRDKLVGPGFKIGIAWQGNEAIDIGRSFALTELLCVSEIPNVRLISLQKNRGVEQLRALPQGMKVECFGDDFDLGDDAFLDTAAIMTNLDLIISSDTSLAHLAGALGRPVWVALQHAPDWRWMLDRTDSPWYPTMRLFRQHAKDHWRDVFLEIESALRADGRRMSAGETGSTESADAESPNFVGRADRQNNDPRN